MAEFKVVIEGVKLSATQETALREDLQRVALKHLAELDFRGDRGAAILPLGEKAVGPDGGTQGIIARMLEPKVVQQLFRGE
jgi:hypothetical protein